MKNKMEKNGRSQLLIKLFQARNNVQIVKRKGIKSGNVLKKRRLKDKYYFNAIFVKIMDISLLIVL